MNNRTIKTHAFPDHHGPAVATRFLMGVNLACALAASPLVIADPAELVESARCSMCHHAEAARVGPSWAAIAERYAGQDDAQQTLVTRARAGGSGEWGKAPMPPVSEAQLSAADLEAVVAWILDR
jgi:cytochrome c